MKKMFQEGKSAAPRILIFVAALLTIVYFFLNKFLPEEFEISFTKPFILLFLLTIAITSFTYLIYPLIMRYSRYAYQITEKGIEVTGGTNSVLLRWDKIEGYTLAVDENVPEISVLTIYGQGTRRRLYLPEGRVAEDITKVVSERVQLIGREPDSFKEIKLSKLHYIYLCVFSLVYSIFASYFIGTHPHKFVFLLIMLCVLVFGPGTLGLVGLFGRRFLTNKYIKAYALAFNVLAAGLTMLFTVLFLLYHFSKQIG